MKNKLIDADSYLKNFCNRFCSVKECTSTQKKSCCIAISLKDEPAVENVTDTNVGGKWIPCSERLPKQGERIIGTFDNGNGKTIVSEEQFFMPLIEKPYPMIAWMPLPQPYKGE